MSTTELWLAETEMNLLSGDKDERNTLAQAVDASETTLPFVGALEGIQSGAYVGLDLEVVYVTDATETAKSASVIRGALGSTPAAHAANTIAYVNPRFTRWQMFRALNAELRDLPNPPKSVFQVKTFTLISQPVAMTYAIPAINNDILGLLELRYSFPDALQAWPKIPLRAVTLLADMPTTSFASGLAIRIDEPLIGGRPIQVRYAAPFTELVDMTSDIIADTGLPASATDIPPLGAAARLMGVREAKRSFIESEGDSRRASEVQSGSAARAAAVMLQMLERRVASEAARLHSQYPETK